MRVRTALFGAGLCLYLAPTLCAQDAVKVDPKHYTVVTENDRVRVLKVHYGPHEKSVMHSHPATVAVFLNDAKVQFTFPDNKTQELVGKAADAQYSQATTHLPENTGEQGMDLVVIELKGKAAKSAKAEMR